MFSDKSGGEEDAKRTLLPGVYAISLPGEVRDARAQRSDEDYEDDAPGRQGGGAEGAGADAVGSADEILD
jgi:hypothetical protein